MASPDKKRKGQFYTVNHETILEGFPGPPDDARCVLEPFAGQGDLLTWLATRNPADLPIEAYDIDPKHPDVVQRDTLTHPPDYSGAWVITNPPYLARNKCADKALYDLYETNDLYKCFFASLCASQRPCRGGAVIVPVGFFVSPRPVDARVRRAFMQKYRVLQVRYFEQDIFPDTTTTVVAFLFEAAGHDTPLTSQDVPWTRLPARETRTFAMCNPHDWIIGGDVYALTPPAAPIRVRRHVHGHPLADHEQCTSLTLSALDSGKEGGRIALNYRHGHVYPAKDTSRTFATLVVSGMRLTEEVQEDLARRFNAFLEARRTETWSLFLPQFRESKEYARKRLPFDLAYAIVKHLLTDEK